MSSSRQDWNKGIACAPKQPLRPPKLTSTPTPKGAQASVTTSRSVAEELKPIAVDSTLIVVGSVAAVGTTSRATSARSKLRDFPWLSPIQTLQHKQDLTGLTPKRGLVAAQPIERIGWQVGQPNKGVGEIVGLVGKYVGRGCASINASGVISLIRP